MTKPVLTKLQLLGRASEITGRPTLRRLRRGESPSVVTLGLDRIDVVLSVERAVDITGGMKVTHRGVRWLVFHRDPATDTWIAQAPTETLVPLQKPEYHMSFGVVTEAEYNERRAHEAMCYRPGTPSCPMDNFPRQRQGY